MFSDTPCFLSFFQNIGPIPFLVILIIALIVFGKRLPEVARSMGKGIVEFKKGLRGVEDDVDRAGQQGQQIPPETRQHSPAAQGNEQTSSPGRYESED